MEYISELVQLVVVAIVGGAFKYVTHQLTKMKEKQSEIDSRLSVEESKGGSRDKTAEKTLALLERLHEDISSIKEEQGYWRGRHDQDNPS